MNGLGLLTIEDVIKAIYIELKRSEVGTMVKELAEGTTLKELVKSFVDSTMFQRSTDVGTMTKDCLRYMAIIMD